MDQVKELIEKEDFYGAISLLKEQIMESPEDWRPYYEISKCYYKMENTDRALQFLESAEQYAQNPEDKEAVAGIINKIKNPPSEVQEEAKGEKEKDVDLPEISPVVTLVNKHRAGLLSKSLVNIASLVPGGGLLLLGNFFSALFVFAVCVGMLFPVIKQEHLKMMNAFLFPKIEDFLSQYLSYNGGVDDAYKIFFGAWVVVMVLIYLKSIAATNKAILHKYYVCVIREVLQENEICLSIGTSDGIRKGTRYKICRIIAQGDTIGGTRDEPPFGRVKHIGFADVRQAEESICFAKYEFIDTNMVTPEKDDLAFCITK